MTEHPKLIVLLELTTISGFNPNISFFPAKRVKAINERLGHNRLDQLLEQIRALVSTKIKTACAIPQSYIQRRHSLSQSHEFPDWASIQAHISGILVPFSISPPAKY